MHMEKWKMENPAVADGGYNNDRAPINVRVVETAINRHPAI
jgi:hypothetical protein